MSNSRTRLGILAVLLLAGLSRAVADEPAPAPAPEAKEPEPAPPIFLDERARGPVVAAQIVAAGNGLTSAAYLHAGSVRGLWLAKPARDPRVDKGLLLGIEQRRSIKSAGKHEVLSYNILVLHARDVSPADLAKIARKDVFYSNMWEDPQRYVGEPIHFTGKLRRLIRMEAPRSLQNDGVKELYEGWVYPIDKDGDRPYCMVFSELPKNVKMGEKIDYEVECNAYFFKLNRYEAKDPGKSGALIRRDAPMFIGRSFVATAAGKTAAKEEDSGWSITAVTKALPVCVGVVAALIGLVVAMNYWYKRGDRAVQNRIAEARNNTFVLPTENGITDLPADEPKPSRFSTDN